MSVNHKDLSPQEINDEIEQKWPRRPIPHQGDFYVKPVGKVTICGRDIEIIFCDVIVRKKKKGKRKLKEVSEGQSLLISRKKTVRKLTNLINCNSWQWPKSSAKMFPPVFLTLTFREEVKDLPIANRLFSIFMQNYNYRLFKVKDKILQYVAVPEFMENGRVHYHCLIFNLPFSTKNYDIATEVWGHGYIWMKSVYHKTTYGLSKYMSKYLIKAYDDPRLFRKRKYFPSAKVLRPIILKGIFISTTILEALQRTRPPKKIKFRENIIDFIGPLKSYYCCLDDDENISDLFPELDQYTQNVLQSKINKEQDKLKL